MGEASAERRGSGGLGGGPERCGGGGVGERMWECRSHVGAELELIPTTATLDVAPAPVLPCSGRREMARTAIGGCRGGVYRVGACGRDEPFSCEAT